MIRHVSFVVCAIGLLLTSCAPPYGPRSVVTCSGGQRLVGGQCVCALGMTWNGRFCQGEPQAGGCANGHAQFGNLCMCPDGTTLDGAQRCVALECASRNAIISGNECICAAGTDWSSEEGLCVEFTCKGGAVVSGHDCICVDGQVWRDGRCSVPEPEPVVRNEPRVRRESGHRDNRRRGGREHRQETSSCNAYGCWEPGGGCNAYGCWGPGGGCNAYGCWGRDGGCSAYGCWKHGGGCNAYGCWKAPGACNAYGCSDRGECNAYGCP